MRTRTLTALALATALSLAATTGDTPGYYLDPTLDPDDPQNIFFAESQWWFTASEATGVGNVDHEDLAGEGPAFMGWDDSEPTHPVGGATLATSYSGLRATTDGDEYGDRHQFTADGQVTGYLDTLTLDLYFAHGLGTSATRDLFGACIGTYALDLSIDGKRVVDMQTVSETYTSVHWEPVDDVRMRAQLKFVGIHEYLDGRSTPDKDRVGDQDTVHDVHLSVQMFPLCAETLWLYDSVDAPASLLVNRHRDDGSVAAHTTIDVNDPPF